uniref:Macrophage expressed 1 n=2 Tax=Latimeria chalumnae TaxID=7897 RepID=H3A4Y7_LATCH
GKDLTGGFQQCKKIYNLSVLEVLPGRGWDNLRNMDMGTVMNLNFSECRTTEDGEYLIPNDVYVIAQKQSNIEINSELIENWLSYKDSVANSINTEASFFSILNGKFSAQFQQVKIHNVYDQTVTARVQARYHIYSVKSKPYFSLDPGFKRELVEIANHLENNQTRMAQFLTEMLILNYGTHVLTSLDAGASLVQEDQVKYTFVYDNISKKSAVTAAASLNFFNKVNLGFNMNTGTESEIAKMYVENTVSSRIESHGSVPFYPGITLQKWQEGIPNRLVAITKSGLPLHFFINQETLPDLPEPTVKRLATTVKKTIMLYYAINTYPGCVNLKSRNFNFVANVDDGSCQDANTNFTFGGVYQECFRLSGSDAGILCSSLEQKNPLTGTFSCPTDYTPVLLHNEERTDDYSRIECYDQCHTCWIFLRCCKQVCRNVYHTRKAKINAYWCAATHPVPQGSGYLFGGLYSASSENPLTNTHACPSFFYPLTLFGNLKICISNDYEMALQYSVPFGGFFSCLAGNPLLGVLKDQSPGILKDFFYPNSLTNYPMKCPSGYSQHLAYISDGCQILYCIKAGELFARKLLPVKLPPFLHIAAFNLSSARALYVMKPGESSWVKDSQTQMWKIADATDEKKFTQLFQPQGSVSGGAAAGISIAVTTLLAALIALAVYGTKRYKKRGYRSLEGSSMVEDQVQYGAIENSDPLASEAGNSTA